MVPLELEIPESFYQPEERSNYLVTAERKQLWAVHLDLLNKFQEICKRHNLKYWADGGTLLGAVRHQGFIPWDDDIDIVMLRDDFNKFIDFAQEELNYPLRPQEAVLDSLRAKYVQWLCCSSSIPLNQLGEKVGWGRSSAKMINQGNNHFDARLKYPIKNNKEYNKEILSQETCIDYLHFEE